MPLAGLGESLRASGVTARHSCVATGTAALLSIMSIWRDKCGGVACCGANCVWTDIKPSSIQHTKTHHSFNTVTLHPDCYPSLPSIRLVFIFYLWLSITVTLYNEYFFLQIFTEHTVIWFKLSHKSRIENVEHDCLLKFQVSIKPCTWKLTNKKNTSGRKLQFFEKFFRQKDMWYVCMCMLLMRLNLYNMKLI